MSVQVEVVVGWEAVVALEVGEMVEEDSSEEVWLADSEVATVATAA